MSDFTDFTEQSLPLPGVRGPERQRLRAEGAPSLPDRNNSMVVEVASGKSYADRFCALCTKSLHGEKRVLAILITDENGNFSKVAFHDACATSVGVVLIRSTNG